MKKFSRMAGVTLLEVMLVLAVAAMIIVMSIRYYQSATTNQQVNGALSLLQAVQANMDALAQGTGSYSDVSITDMQSLMPNRSFRLPWGEDISVVAQGPTGYRVTIPNMPVAVCLQVNARLAANEKWSPPSTCGTAPASQNYDYSSIAGS